MKANFIKALSLVLVLMLTLTGCNLFEIDPVMQAEDDIAALNKEYSKVAASYDGGEITIADAIGEFNIAYNEMYYYYQMYFGMEMSHEEVHSLVEETLAEMVRMNVVAAQFDAEGMELTEEEMADVQAQADEEYQLNLESALEAAAGKTEEAKNANAGVLLKANGWDYDAVYTNTLLRAKLNKMEQKLRDEVSEISEEDLQLAFEEKVAANQETYTDGYTLENDMSSEGTTAYWLPEGYRTVKHILLIPDDMLMTAYTNALYALEDARNLLSDLDAELTQFNDDDGEIAYLRTAEEIESEIAMVEAEIPEKEAAVADAAQACLDSVKETTDEIYARLEEGEDFADLIAEYGEDPGMQNEPTMSRGYYVSVASQNWEENFRNAAMELAEVGDYTLEPVLSGSGVHIIRYESDVVPGAVSLDEVRDSLYEETLLNLQDVHCTDTISAWVEAVNPVYDVETFEGAFGE